MRQHNGYSGGGVSTLSVIQIVFVILKLLGLIDWPWVYVLLPLWIGLALSGTIIVCLIIAHVLHHDY